MPKRKTTFKDTITAGFEHIINDPKSSPLKDARVFHEIHKASGMPLTEMLHHVGKRALGAKQVASGPTDDELSKQRLARLAKP